MLQLGTAREAHFRFDAGILMGTSKAEMPQDYPLFRTSHAT